MPHLTSNVVCVTRLSEITNGHKRRNIGLMSLVLIFVHYADYAYLVSNDARPQFYPFLLGFYHPKWFLAHNSCMH